MKYSLAILFTLFALPTVVSAHERQMFEINGITYQFVVGSVAEPVYVDDKSGVELRVERINILDGHEEHHHDIGPGAVEGLEATLKVELISGEKRKSLDFSTVYDQPGLYRATFFPTAAEALTYRIFGTLENIPVDVRFTCNPAGHQMESKEDTSRVEIAPGVVRVMKAGSFSCPRDKSELGFPLDTATVARQFNSTSGVALIAWAALALAVLALIVPFARRA